MTKSKIINIANQDNDYHKNLFNKLEEKIGPNAPNFLNDVLDTNDDNLIKEIIFTTEDDEIDDYCVIKGYKDIKDCELYFDKDTLLNDYYLTEIEDYLKRTYDIKTIKIHLKDDKQVNKLSNLGYEDMGDFLDENIVLKDLDELKTKRRRRRR